MGIQIKTKVIIIPNKKPCHQTLKLLFEEPAKAPSINITIPISKPG